MLTSLSGSRVQAPWGSSASWLRNPCSASAELIVPNAGNAPGLDLGAVRGRRSTRLGDERQGGLHAADGARTRLFCRGDALAVPDLPYDVGAAIFGRPSLALEHLEHGKFVGSKRVTLNLLQVGGLGEAPARGGSSGRIGISVRYGHGSRLPQSLRRRYQGRVAAVAEARLGSLHGVAGETGAASGREGRTLETMAILEYVWARTNRVLVNEELLRGLE